MTEWATVTLAELGPIVTGKTPPTAREGFFGGDIPFVTPSDMDGQRIIGKTGRSLTMEGLRTVAKQPIPGGAILVSCIGSDMGKTHIAGRNCFTNQQINSIAVANPNAHPLYVYYNLSGRKDEFQRLAAGSSAQPILNKSSFSRMGISLPPMDVQTVAVELLGSLDDKIELNRRMNETLEAMAQAIFRDWFVDFGPTRRKIDGATDPVEVMGGQVADPDRARELAELFPASIGDSGLPEGWELKGLDQIADFLNGLALQKHPGEGEDNSLPVIKIAELRNGVTSKSNRASRTVPTKYVIKDGDFLFSWSGSLMAKFWTEGEGALNQHLFKVSSSDVPSWFYSLWVNHHMEDFQQIAASKATTMGHIQRGHLRAAMTACPPPKTIDAMTPVLGPLVERTVHNALENRTLAATRDLLIPKLMSGETRLNNLKLELQAAQ